MNFEQKIALMLALHAGLTRQHLRSENLVALHQNAHSAVGTWPVIPEYAAQPAGKYAYIIELQNN